MQRTSHLATLASPKFCTPTIIFCVFTQGPFATFHVRQDYAGCEWTGLKFSNDGKKILVSTNLAQLKLVDAFQGHELNTLTVSMCSTIRICSKYHEIVPWMKLCDHAFCWCCNCEYGRLQQTCLPKQSVANPLYWLWRVLWTFCCLPGDAMCCTCIHVMVTKILHD